LLTVSFQTFLSRRLFFDDVQSLAHVVTHRQDLVRQYLGKYAAMQDRPFSALNTAFMSEGAFVSRAGQGDDRGADPAVVLGEWRQGLSTPTLAISVVPRA